MRRLLFLTAGAACAAMSVASTSLAAPILQSTDFIIAIDADPPMLPVSEYPGTETPFEAFDDIVDTKYLNFGERNSGVIVTPLGGPSIIQSMILSTANDVVARDPATWKIWGTNDAIVTPDNAVGPNAENWTLISEGTVALPATRLTPGPVLPFATNMTSYASYRITFPTVKDFVAANSMQVSEIGLYTTSDGTGTNIALFPSNALAILLDPIPTFNSSSPAGEPVQNLLDGATTEERMIGGVPTQVLTKYLNFGEENSGFIVTPSGVPKVVTSFQLTTAFDAVARDPATWELYGTNSPIMSQNHTDGTAENWTLIEAGAVELPEERDTAGPIVPVNNTMAYSSYKMLFPTVKDLPAEANSMQLAGVQFFDSAAVSDADFDGDGDVDGSDFLTWQRGLGLTGQTNNDNGDADASGIVDAADLAAWKGQFGAAVGAAGAVPEPATAGLALLGIFGLAAMRRKRSG